MGRKARLKQGAPAPLDEFKKQQHKRAKRKTDDFEADTDEEGGAVDRSPKKPRTVEVRKGKENKKQKSDAREKKGKGKGKALDVDEDEEDEGWGGVGKADDDLAAHSK